MVGLAGIYMTYIYICVFSQNQREIRWTPKTLGCLFRHGLFNMLLDDQVHVIGIRRVSFWHNGKIIVFFFGGKLVISNMVHLQSPCG